MSFWYEVEKEDIDFSDLKDEIHLYLDDDHNGAIYASVKTQDILDLLKSQKED